MATLVQLQPFPSGRRSRPTVLLAVVLTAQLMVVLDATIVNVALPHMQESLGFSSSSLSWVLNAYVLTFGGLLLLGARAGDIVGRRRTFLAGIVLFSLASLAGGFAATSWMLLASRAVQGVGGALAAPSALALLTTAFAEGPARVRAIGLYTTMSAAGGAIGLVAGGLLTEWASWRWVMFVNVPIGLAVVVLGRRALPETETRPGRLDLAGAVTSTAGLTGIVLALVEAGTSGWARPMTVVPLVAGVALLAAFVRIEQSASEPVLPLRLVTNASRTAANVARGLVYAGMYGMVFFLTQFLQDVQGHSPLLTGVGFLPTPASVFLSSQLTSKVLARRLPPKAIMVGGIAVAAAGLVLATQLHAGTGYPQVLASLVLIGTGMGTALVSLTSASLADVAPGDAGAASGLVNVVQQLGAALGLAVLVTVFDAVTAPGTGPSLAPGLSAHARTALVHGLDVTFGVGALFSLVALGVVSLLVRSRRTEADARAENLDLVAQAQAEAAA